MQTVARVRYLSGNSNDSSARNCRWLEFTYNTINPSTQYQNGVDMHLDWGASQFLTKQWQVGLVGYLYKEIGAATAAPAIASAAFSRGCSE